MDLPPIARRTALDPAANSERTNSERANTERANLQARATAEAFEAAFLAEMLKYSGVNALPSGFDGGAGEEAFASFLTQEYARLMAARGGIGLAEQVFEILKQKANGT